MFFFMIMLNFKIRNFKLQYGTYFSDLLKKIIS